MPHPAGERLRCDACGAEIEFVKPCTCPDGDPKRHPDVCCGQPMRSLGVRPDADNEQARPELNR